MTQKRVSTEELERRYDSVRLTGGSYDERRHALQAWKTGILQDAEQDTKRANRKAAKALSAP